MDKLGHLLLHLFSLQLLLQEDLEARHRGGPLGVLLVGLQREEGSSFKKNNNSGPINKQWLRSCETSLLFGFDSVWGFCEGKKKLPKRDSHLFGALA